MKLTAHLTHNRAVVLMLLVTFMWSTAGVVTRHLEVVKGFEVTFWRSFFTVVSLAIILPLFMGRGVFAKIRHAGKTFWFSSLCWCGMFTFYMMALMLTSVANVLVTMAIGPLLTALFARFFIGHRMPPRTWVAIVVAGIGIGWMYGSQIAEGHLLGTLVALGVPLSGAANWTFTQHAQGKAQAREHAHGKSNAYEQAQSHDVDLMPAVLVGATLSCLITLPLALPFQATAHDLSLLAGLGLGQLAIPCVLAVMCTRVLKAPEVSLLALLEVPFGILLVWIGANEAPNPAVIVGGGLVIGALVTNELIGWRARK